MKKPAVKEEVQLHPFLLRARQILRGKAVPPVFCFLSGMTAAYAMPPRGLWLCMFAGIGLFFVLVNSVKDPVRGFRYGWLFGFGFFLFGLYWVGNALLVDGNPYSWALPLAIFGLPAMLALFPAAAMALNAKFLPEDPYTRFIQFIVLLALAEWIRGHILTGFPWNLFAYGWADSAQISQSVSLGGVYFLSLLTIFWASWPGLVFMAGKVTKPGVLVVTGLVILSFSFIYAFGSSRLDIRTQFDKDFRIKIVQPSIPQSEKWSATKLDENYEKLLSISGSDLEDIKTTTGRTLIVWPETAISWPILDNPDAMEQIRILLHSYPHETLLATGVLRYEKSASGNVEYRNSIDLFDYSGKVSQTYDKSHLVPFGEYIPMQYWIPLPPIAGFNGFTAGSGPVIMPVSGPYTISPLVCYEIIFPGNVVKDVDGKMPDAIVNVTNDAWYGLSAGPYQHLQQAVFRAIEEGIPVIRSANTGISAVIDPYGRFVTKIPLFQERSARVFLPRPAPVKTPYSKGGDTLFFILLIMASALKFALDRIRE